jgi:nucleoside-diphosphate kinase
MEQTLIVFKPDAIQRGLVGEILARFERAGLKLVAMKMLTATDEHLEGHYEGIGGLRTRKGDHIYDITIELMKSGPVLAGVLEGIDAVDNVRKMVGGTEPKSAAPGTLRGDYAHMSYGHADAVGKGIPNMIHASADASEAGQEIPHWFSKDEIHSYANTHDVYTQPRG